MPAQSEALAKETAVMRRFDKAMQDAAAMGGRAHVRVLRYVADQVAEQLEHAQFGQPGGDSSFGTAVTARGGNGQAAGFADSPGWGDPTGVQPSGSP